MIPVVKAKRTAKSDPKSAFSAVMSAMIAVGPTVTSFVLPKMQYMKHPMKAEYKPY